MGHTEYISAEEFSALDHSQQMTLVKRYCDFPEFVKIRLRNPLEAESLIFEMISTNRLARFVEMEFSEQNLFCYLYHQGKDSELLFMVDEITQEKMIHPFGVVRNIFFWGMQETMSPLLEMYEVSENLQEKIHQYFQKYGDLLPDIEPGVKPKVFQLSEINPVAARNRSLVTHTVIALSETYGEEKVIPIFDRLIEEDLAGPRELIKLVQSDVEIVDSAPIAWTLEMC